MYGKADQAAVYTLRQEDNLDQEFVARHLVAHRGRWTTTSAANSRVALASALKGGFGLETDLRDYKGHLVISHDPLRTIGGALTGEAFVSIFCQLGGAEVGPVALNIKSDGLVPLLLDWVGALPDDKFFFFDMSVPETLAYAKAGLPVALRVSEFEPVNTRLVKQFSIGKRWWLDSFRSDWWLNDDSIEVLCLEGELHIVSPEIHGRDPRAVWEWFGSMLQSGASVYLCTDHVDKALEALA